VDVGKIGGTGGGVNRESRAERENESDDRSVRSH
jgi:hypothetical protein